MAKPICYIHAGIGKTGSTAIQYALAKLHDVLLEHGYHYPDITDNFHRALNFGTTGGNAGMILKGLQKHGSSCVAELVKPYSTQGGNLILSCEAFSKSSLRQLQDLAQGLDQSGYHTKCLVFFRPQADLAVSRYLQRVKGNKVQKLSLDGYLEQMIKSDKEIDPKWNWYLNAKKLGDAFGEDNITVKWYPCVMREDSQGVVGTTLEWLGLNLDEETLSLDKKVVNPTPGREALMILERMNSIGWGNKRFSEKFLMKAHRQKVLGSRIIPCPDLMSRIHSASRSSNARLLEKYCPEISVETELAQIKPTDKESAINPETVAKLNDIALHIFRKNVLDG